MPFINWSSDLSIGVVQIDGQHQKLVGMVNRLHDAMKNRTGAQEVAAILSELVEYTKYHFATEEKLMQQHGYPETQAHKTEHTNLTKQVAELAVKVGESNTSLITIETMNFLRDWLKNHILGTDMKFGQFLQSKGVQ